MTMPFACQAWTSMVLPLTDQPGPSPAPWATFWFRGT